MPSLLDTANHSAQTGFDRAFWHAEVESPEGRQCIRVLVDPIRRNTDQRNWRYDFVFENSTCDLNRLSLSIRLRCWRSWYLSAQRTLETVEKLTIPPYPVSRFVITQTTGQFLLWQFQQAGPLELRFENDHLEIDFVLLDKSACGLRAWGPKKLSSLKDAIRISSSCTPFAELQNCIWAEPFPEGARSAIVLTDHADFDSSKKLSLLLPVFRKTEFRLTKSVFPHSDIHPHDPNKREPGLDDSEYRKLIRELHEQGTEIAFHGFSPRVSAPKTAECRRRAALLSEFGPQTWIDHGTGGYLYSKRARLNDGQDLANLLEQFGVINFWSYYDVWDNPFASLSSWKRRVPGDWIAELGASGKHLLRSSASQTAYFGLHAVKNLAGAIGLQALRSKRQEAASWRRVQESAVLHWQVARRPLMIYGEDGACFSLAKSRRWIFDTVLLNHLSLQLDPAAIGQLHKDSGLLLGHCYLGAEHGYAKQNVFRAHDRGITIESRFVTNLEYINEMQRTNSVRSTSFAELRRGLSDFAACHVEGDEQGWKIRLDDRERAYVAGFAPEASVGRDKYGARQVTGKIRLVQVKDGDAWDHPARLASARSFGSPNN